MNAFIWPGLKPAAAPAWEQLDTRSPNVSPGDDGTKIVRPRAVRTVRVDRSPDRAGGGVTRHGVRCDCPGAGAGGSTPGMEG
jgi:hypothetical protein